MVPFHRWRSQPASQRSRVRVRASGDRTSAVPSASTWSTSVSGVSESGTRTTACGDAVANRQAMPRDAGIVQKRVDASIRDTTRQIRSPRRGNINA
jgi:hypothetical protein